GALVLSPVPLQEMGGQPPDLGGSVPLVALLGDAVEERLEKGAGLFGLALVLRVAGLRGVGAGDGSALARLELRPQALEPVAERPRAHAVVAVVSLYQPPARDRRLLAVSA